MNNKDDCVLSTLSKRLSLTTSKKLTLADYHQSSEFLDSAYWDDKISLKELHNFYAEMETFYAKQKQDNRFSFVVVIPVADRPEQLNECLGSLKTLCDCFQYGGFDGHYKKVSVLIADDSEQVENINLAKQSAKTFTQQGLNVEYFGQQQQWECVSDIADQADYKAIFGDLDKQNFYHKGPSVTRNICYLKLNKILQDKPKTLCFFVDSDEQFQVLSQSEKTQQIDYALNYFYHYDQLFEQQDISVVSAKYVGDPPVSPAVMADNFLQDSVAFLKQMSGLENQHNCQFHQHSDLLRADAVYHDMPELFGFSGPADSVDYHCKLQNEHNNAACFEQFVFGLNRFFYGEHQTRNSFYQHNVIATDQLQAARTVYTGNYVFNKQGLSFFIPFADLRLRMAGPTLGRIIQQQIKQQFITTNLPVLHQRTLSGSGEAEFRPGIESASDQSAIDLSDEFERQFFGDMMLFCIIEMLDKGWMENSLTEQEIEQIYTQTEIKVLALYEQKHQSINARNKQLKALIINPECWWNQSETHLALVKECLAFIDNIDLNFSDHAKGYQQISSVQHRLKRKAQLLNSIRGFKQDQVNWSQLLDT